jgi:uncharacterized protein (TIGR02246 family)
MLPTLRGKVRRYTHSPPLCCCPLALCMYLQIDGKWLILDHHSSAMPETAEKLLADVAGLFDKWNAALQTRDPKVVTAMYAKDGVLLPTVSNDVRTNHAEIEDYFVYFLKLEPFGTIDSSSVRMIAPNAAINSGIYTFAIVSDGKPAKVQARYSFTYKKVRV